MKVAIIGGAGKMGRWFARFLKAEGKEVVISGRDAGKLDAAARELGVARASNIEAASSADVVVLSVPLESFEPVLKEISPHLKGQTVVDVTSVKAVPVSLMHKYVKNGTALGLHPLFGPGAKGISGQNFVLTPTNEKETALAQKVKAYLEERGAKVSVMTPAAHDEKMSVILGLSHFIAIVAADALVSSGNLEGMGEAGGITYKVLLTLVESVLSEDPELYASLQLALPDVTAMESLFLRKAKAWADLVKNKDRQGFVQQMSALKDRLAKGDPDFGQAYEKMYRIVAGL